MRIICLPSIKRQRSNGEGENGDTSMDLDFQALFLLEQIPGSKSSRHGGDSCKEDADSNRDSLGRSRRVGEKKYANRSVWESSLSRPLRGVVTRPRKRPATGAELDRDLLSFDGRIRISFRHQNIQNTAEDRGWQRQKGCEQP